MKFLKIKQPLLFGIITILTLTALIHFLIYHSLSDKSKRLRDKTYDIEEHTKQIAKKIDNIKVDYDCPPCNCPKIKDCPACVCNEGEGNICPPCIQKECPICSQKNGVVEPSNNSKYTPLGECGITKKEDIVESLTNLDNYII